jgi:DNA modification methylase
MNRSLSQKIIYDKKNGLSDLEIGNKYNVNYRKIEELILKDTGVNISNPSGRKKKISKYSPNNFSLEETSVWSFKSRGNWATHNGNYRGNWSPYIPRNIIIMFSNEGDTVLDYFCGGGTTAIESKLLNRNFIGFDINPNAIELAKQNIDFTNNGQNPLFSPKTSLGVGDARDLKKISNNSIDLICAHPPYSNIINYTHENNNDLSNLDVEDFLVEIERVAKESYRVLKDNKHCAILIGDMRRNKNVIPLGFWTIKKFLDSGFEIKELIIKRQHNCKTTGFWYKNSVKYNFLLLAHEYLAVFKKVESKDSRNSINVINNNIAHKDIDVDKEIELESKTVWIFDNESWLDKTISNLILRYADDNYQIIKDGDTIKDNLDLLITFYDENISENYNNMLDKIKPEGIFAIICDDYRKNKNLLYSTAMEIEEKFKECENIKIKEIVIISIENGTLKKSNSNLGITHKYLLIYKKA